MRAVIGVLILLILGGNIGVATADQAVQSFCGSSRLTRALQYVNWHEKNISYNQDARAAALRDSVKIQSMAKTMAWSSSLLFLICISVLVAAITYRVVDNKNLSAILGTVYFLFFAFVISSSGEPIADVTNALRVEANTLKIDNVPHAITGPEKLHEFIALLKQDQARVPEVFNELSSYLPPDSRWWTMGWDDVSLIDFQNEAYKALLRKGNFGLRALSIIKKDLERLCLASGIQI